MKNIHVLQTEKPSELYINMQGILSKSNSLLLRLKSRHIYITNSEEIKEGDWFTDDNNSLKTSYKLSHVQFANPKKIILTTDRDLIKDGVQAIDDEFLEWFVKNPSCEFVEVNNLCYGALGGFADAGYKIILPKEEPKRKIDSCYNFDMEIGCVQDICRCEQEEPKTNLERLPFPELVEEFAEYYKKVPLIEEPKQETTLEEEHNKVQKQSLKKHQEFVDKTDSKTLDLLMSEFDGEEELLIQASKKIWEEQHPNPIEMALFGFRWQQEQYKKMYSEEDMNNYAEYCTSHVLKSQIGHPYLSVKEWFEQFRKN
jgi:hypothetical protein